MNVRTETGNGINSIKKQKKKQLRTTKNRFWRVMIPYIMNRHGA